MVHVPSQRHSRIRALILRDADMTDLELRSGTPYQPLYRISGSLRPDPLAGIDAWGCYTLSAHLCSLRRLIFRISFFDVDRIYLFFSRNEGKTLLENHFYDGPFDSGTHHFETSTSRISFSSTSAS